MVSQKEISSTKKLLDLIKLGKKANELNDPGQIPLSADANGTPSLLLPRPSDHHETTVGVSISSRAVTLVMVGQTQHASREILDYQTVPFRANLTPEDQAFPEFLQPCLKQFCGSLKKVAIWSAISAAEVEMRRLKIPKVPKKQIANAVYWTYKKEVPFNEKEIIFDFEVLGNITETGLEKIEVMAYTASRREVEKRRALFAKIGFPLAGITIIPFGLQNMVRTGWIETGGRGVCSLHVGSNWSRIDIFSANGNLALFRGIKIGVNSLIDSIRKELLAAEETSAEEADISHHEETDESLAINEPLDEPAVSAAQPQDHPSPEEQKAKAILFNLINAGESTAEYHAVSGSSEENIFNPIIFSRTIHPVLVRLIRQVERTINHYALKFNNEGINRIFISGEISTSTIILNDLRNNIPYSIETLDPFVFGSRSTVPGTLAERIDYTPAAGLALSANTLTPNFIFTYRDKEQQEKVSRINRLTLSAASVALILGLGVFSWQIKGLAQGKTQYVRTQQELKKYEVLVDTKMIDELVPKIKENASREQDLSARYLGIAVLNELSRINCPNIRLLKVEAVMPQEQGKKEEGPQDKARKITTTPRAPKKILTLEGVVMGSELTFDADLAAYLVKLKDSPIFGPPAITNRSTSIFEMKKALHFSAQMDLAQDHEL